MIYLDKEKNIGIRRFRAGWIVVTTTQKVSSRVQDNGKIIDAKKESFHANINQVAKHLLDNLIGNYSEEVDINIAGLFKYLDTVVEDIEKLINLTIEKEEI